MSGIAHLIALTAPLFLLVLIGYALTRLAHWPVAASGALTRFVFTVAMPTLLFQLMSDFSRLPRVDAWLLAAYFGGCVVTYILARLVAATVFKLDGASQSVFAMGGIFSNNVLLGVPLAKVTLGDDAMPAVSLVLVFNSLTLWTLVTVSVEWARDRDLSLAGLGRTLVRVLLNPIVAAILLGTAFGFTRLQLWPAVAQTIGMISQSAVPLSLIALGMGLAEFGLRSAWQQSATISAFKLIVQPLAVYAIALLLDLPALETAAVVVLAALPVGANVYLMSRQFGVMVAPAASSIVLTTLLAAFTTPIVLTLLRVKPP
jgi:predicted permease